MGQYKNSHSSFGFVAKILLLCGTEFGLKVQRTIVFGQKPANPAVLQWSCDTEAGSPSAHGGGSSFDSYLRNFYGLVFMRYKRN